MAKRPPRIPSNTTCEREVTDAERQLWYEVMEDGELQLPAQEIMAEEPEEAPPLFASREQMVKLLNEGVAGRGASEPPAKKPQQSIDWKRARDLRQGRIEPEAKLDLHGMTQGDAWDRLKNFIHHAHMQGKKSVLVITGKGSRGTGVLRECLPRWLQTEPCRAWILAFSRAHIRHGGEGAFYVLLRRSK